MTYTNEQHFLSHRGRRFHFVSYAGKPANAKSAEPATDAAWFLMSAGKRWAVMPQLPDQDPAELDILFARWLDQHVFC